MCSASSCVANLIRLVSSFLLVSSIVLRGRLYLSCALKPKCWFLLLALEVNTQKQHGMMALSNHAAPKTCIFGHSLC